MWFFFVLQEQPRHIEAFTIPLKLIWQQSKTTLLLLFHHLKQQAISLLFVENPKTDLLSLVSKEQDPSASAKVLPPPTFKVNTLNPKLSR